MAVEIPAQNAWSGRPIIVNNMQETAQDNHAWSVYRSLNQQQRQDFHTALALVNIVVPLDRVRQASAPIAAPVAAPVAPTPAAMGAARNDIGQFRTWLHQQATLVAQSPGLAFDYSNARKLPGGKMVTHSVDICIRRHGLVVADTQFVFHYHPGASGPSVGSGYASVGHFKPEHRTGALERVERHQCAGAVLEVYRRATTLAKTVA